MTNHPSEPDYPSVDEFLEQFRNDQKANERIADELEKHRGRGVWNYDGGIEAWDWIIQQRCPFPGCEETLTFNVTQIVRHEEGTTTCASA